MASIIAGTWSLISSSAEVISKARGMTLGIHKLLLSPDRAELSDADRRRLLGLQRRVQCMVQPLNFLLLWSKRRDLRVQQVVLSAQELLFDIYSFIECLSPEDPMGQGRSRRSSVSNATKSEQLEFFLRELDFTCISVNMAVSMEARPVCGNGRATGAGVSLLALLRAHRRVKEMEGRSGHLCAMVGCLYRKAEAAACDTSLPAQWVPALSLATLKVVSRETKSYGVEVESRLPLSQDASFSETGVGLNSFARLEFPISVALKARLVTTRRLELNLTAGGQDLAVDSVALVWSDEGQSFTFVFDGKASEELALTPLDAAYLAKLCAGARFDLDGETAV
ncbi:unnamed protein product [Effrenium voratum]|uniref:Uncharacterized protein n=1 Tax=Effrenium voratum TaxID=2562239 RepID=A0AA36I9T1_9DINO|nr:unnamed protein product [Effrenium voratum]CAJ1426605.1 unnamed protein product [Effrenium voratum]